MKDQNNGMANQQSNDEGMRELALFAGAGGGILGGKLLGWRTVCAVEWDAYAASVLVARQNDGCLEPFPVWDDVQTFDGRPWRGLVDVVSGGFPCQDLSRAKTHDSGGKFSANGLDGERSGLWREMFRIVREVGPRFVFVENVTALLDEGIGIVLRDLAQMGYDAQWGVLSASALGSPHHRERVFLVADSQRIRREEKVFFPLGLISGSLPQTPKGEFGRTGFISGTGAWSDGRQIESSILGLDDRVACGMDRLTACGNAQVPAVAATAWRILK